jgi:hypothetical protein
MDNSSKPKSGYVSLNREETALLDALPFEERWLYVKLKWLANFKTGRVGKFGRRVLTYEGIGDMISVPSSQGRAVVLISGGEVKRMINRLESAGLITDHAYDSKAGVTLTLQLSPIRPASTQSERLQTEAPMQSLAKAHGTTVCDERPSPQSVLMSYGHNNTFFNNEGAGDTPAPRRPQCGSPPPPSPKEADKTDSAPLTVARIRELIAASWVEFHYLDTPETMKFFRNWIKKNVTDTDLRNGIEAIGAGNATPTAGAIDTWLNQNRPTQPSQRKGRSSATGRVVL